MGRNMAGSIGRDGDKNLEKSARTSPVKGAAASRSGRASPHRIRIIGGQWKRTPLTVLDAPGLRPTPDRIRETLFNWLEHLFDGAWSDKRCLDLFSGSGALGFEAASRGAQDVVLVESNARAVLLLEESREKLHAKQIKISQGDLQGKQTPAALKKAVGSTWFSWILPIIWSGCRDFCRCATRY
jgi:16S rRNA (guanine966-N2)-methyltransferase